MSNFNEINELLLRRKDKILVNTVTFYMNDSTERIKRMVVSAIKNFETYGFKPDKKTIEIMLGMPEDVLAEFYKTSIAAMKLVTGADKVYNPMYPNFPKQVMDADDIELFVNAIFHYFTSGLWKPEYEKDERFPLITSKELKEFSIGSYADVYKISENLLSSKTNISNQDKDDIQKIFSWDYETAKFNMPKEILLKENVGFLAKIAIEHNDADLISEYVKTATDVLRIVTSISDGDVSLAKNCKFKNLTNRERRLVMNLLVGCKNPLEDMFRYRERWLRIAYFVHPFSFKGEKYTKINGCFNTLINGYKPLFFAGKVQKTLNENRISDTTDILASRPGEFARRLSELLRKSSCFDEEQYIIDKFASCVDEVSVPVLLQVKAYFENCLKDKKFDVVFPKGSTAKMWVSKSTNKNKDISQIAINRVIAITKAAIEKQLSAKGYMGKVFIDESLRDVIVPFSQRSASDASKILTRGSRYKISDETKVIRSFIWWTNYMEKYSDGKEYEYRVDIDLSAGYFDEDFNSLGHVSYIRLMDDAFGIVHSGDIVNGGSPNGDGVAEFIDIDIDKFINASKKSRYVIFNIYAYTNQPFSKMNVRFGWMGREDMMSGEIFDPRTVEMFISLKSDNISSMPVIFDLKTREFIWCDMGMGKDGYVKVNDIENRVSTVKILADAFLDIGKTNLYDLIKMNVSSRGFQVMNRADADVIFSLDKTKPTEKRLVYNEETGEMDEIEVELPVEIITPFDIDYIVSNLM